MDRAGAKSEVSTSETIVTMTPEDIVRRIMSAHWDMAACRCWVCVHGRASGIHPVEKMLCHVGGNREKLPVPHSGWGGDYRR